VTNSRQVTLKPGHGETWLNWKAACFSTKLLLINGVVIFQCGDLAMLLLTCTSNISVRAHAVFLSSFQSLNPSFMSK